MDILVLNELQKGSLSGYDVIGILHRRFDLLVSSGTVYSLLYSLERDGLIKGNQIQRTRVYELTEKGKDEREMIIKVNDEVHNFLRSFKTLNSTIHS